MTDKPELKVCPFCGGAARSIGSQWVGCDNLGCPGRGHVTDSDTWNKRAPNTFEILPGGFVGIRCPKCGHEHTQVRSDDEPKAPPTELGGTK